MLIAGGLMLAFSLRAAKATATRSRYRPDPWRAPEWCTVAAGIAPVAAFVVAAHVGVSGLHPAYFPMHAPALPLLPAVGVLGAALPACCTPELPAEIVP
jgi:energy-coupling factor transport system permease protein